MSPEEAIQIAEAVIALWAVAFVLRVLRSTIR